MLEKNTQHWNTLIAAGAGVSRLAKSKNPIHDGGHNNATTEAAQIELWWDEHPDANIGLNPIGERFAAVDVDFYKPDCQWEEFKGDRPFAPECIHQSARGGFHYIFKAEEGQTFSNPCAGVDIKHNGYIVLAPSTFEGKPTNGCKMMSLQLSPIGW